MRRIIGKAGVFQRILFPILAFGSISVLFFACLPPEAKQVKSIRIVPGDHPIEGKVDGRSILILADKVKKA